MFESDINPIFVTLSEHYLNQDAPKLNVAFFDIEVDFDPDRGYSTPEDAFMPITSIAVHLQWLETLVCFAVPPKTLTWEQAQEEIKEFHRLRKPKRVINCKTTRTYCLTMFKSYFRRLRHSS